MQVVLGSIAERIHAALAEPLWLGEEAIRGAKRYYRWPDENAKFLIPDGVYEHFQQGIFAFAAIVEAFHGRRRRPEHHR